MTSRRVTQLVYGGAAFALGTLAGMLTRRYLDEDQIRPSEPRNARPRRSKWRSPIDSDGRFAGWISEEIRDQNGVYLIRDQQSGELLYIGESHRGHLDRTLKRHLWSWDGRGSGPTYAPGYVEAAIELFADGSDAVDRQFELIQSLKPRDNVLDGHSLTTLEEAPF